jgi:hypothetical protein
VSDRAFALFKKCDRSLVKSMLPIMEDFELLDSEKGQTIQTSLVGERRGAMPLKFAQLDDTEP